MKKLNFCNEKNSFSLRKTTIMPESKKSENRGDEIRRLYILCERYFRSFRGEMMATRSTSAAAN